MLTPFNLLLLTAVFGVVMLFVLLSLMRSGITGVRHWLAAIVCSIVSLLLYAARGKIAPILTFELANALYGAAICLLYTGVCRFLSRPVPAKLLFGTLALLIALIAVFHYGYDLLHVRIALVSIFHGGLCLAIGLLLLRAPQTGPTHYSYRFTAFMAILFAFAHAVRGVVHGTGIEELSSAFQSAPVNLLFISLGALVMPVFTMGVVMIVHDRMMEQAMAAANRDFLTGAWSRRAFFEFADRELVRVQRNRRALSLLLFDVDHFKRINDTHGHAIGDRVLTEIVQRTEKELRGMDCIARVGGEEFAALLPEVDAASALVVAERLRAALGTHVVTEGPTVNAAIAYTVSIGVATLVPSESIAELMRRADIALYEAKAGGRNAVVCAVPDSADKPVIEVRTLPLPAR
ncbi:MAG TPA: GGDEF domain-containing protein [Oxalicibacterium sp.]|uniref:GGDEF domain-containing protein n=1 Tax=Oxalicibacterium sp. TaxID=2766525 RepID=UPI002C44ACDB|nr:GGDEF domain-containing protein [Oxalicibacterium sp.]HWU97314.1 GGDEF domain-containing protein [Oxalicibacterium sp.]